MSVPSSGSSALLKHQIPQNLYSNQKNQKHKNYDIGTNLNKSKQQLRGWVDGIHVGGMS